MDLTELVGPNEAALRIGCSPSYVRLLIREGKLDAIKVDSRSSRTGYIYKITVKEVERFKALPVNHQGNRGKPRRGPY